MRLEAQGARRKAREKSTKNYLGGCKKKDEQGDANLLECILIKRCWAACGLSFNGQCQQVDEHGNRKRFFNELIDAAADGF